MGRGIQVLFEKIGDMRGGKVAKGANVTRGLDGAVIVVYDTYNLLQGSILICALIRPAVFFV